MSIRNAGLWLFCFCFFIEIVAADDASEKQQLQGQWEVTELVEDGKVIPREAIREWLPSGGRIEIKENALIFDSPENEKKHVKLFSIDTTSYPKNIDLSTRDQKDVPGIYQFDKGKLIVCLSDPEIAKRPSAFAARQGSGQMLMILERTTSHASEKSAATQQPQGITAKLLTDAQVTKMLHGTWQFSDSIGNLYTTFNTNGTFSTVREVKEIRLFQKVFVETAVSSGQWTVNNGKVSFRVLSSIHWDRVNKTADFSIRSITATDLIFVDPLGHVGKSVKVR